MCGIAGLIEFGGAEPRAELIAAMNRLQAHRGPDDQGVHVDGRMGFGHTRLSILDITPAGHQPMSYAGGRYWISFNGEIYNFLELRDELEARGHSFVSETDTEIILAAYAEWGEDCQLRFNGMWGFAIWDSAEQRLFLSRDRFGVKPVHYWHDSGRLAFASEMKAFLALPFVELSYDAQALALALTNPYAAESGEACLLSGVRKLPPGHCLTVGGDGKGSVRRWWDTLEHLPDAEPTPEARDARLHELFMDACALRMRADVPIASALSGGLDSSLVHCAIARLGAEHPEARHRPTDWQKAFHAGFAGTSQDEREYAEEVVRHAGTQPMFTEIDPAEVVAHTDDAIFAGEAVTDNMAALWLTYREMRRNGNAVSLDGHGADELYAGYHHQVALAVEHAANEAEAEERRRTVEDMTVAGREKYNNPGTLRRVDFLNLAPPPDPRAQRMAEIASRSGFDPVTLQLYADFHVETLPPILRNFDRLSMAHGVEIRAPFLDWRLVCHAFTVPVGDKIAGGYSKAILRRALGDLLPVGVRTRKSKLGFITPLAEWAGEALDEYILEAVSSTAFRSFALWDGKRIAETTEQHLLAGDRRIVNWGWAFIQTFRLIERFNAAAREARGALDAV